MKLDSNTGNEQLPWDCGTRSRDCASPNGIMAEREMHIQLPDLFTSAQWRVLSGHLGLTPRQTQIARLTCRGLGRSGIGQRLEISEHTVRMHNEELYRRLRINDRIGIPVRFVLAARQLWSIESQMRADTDKRPY